MYTYIKDNLKSGKSAKGVKKNIIKNNIKHEDYKQTLFNKKQMHQTIKTIRSINHQLGSYELDKISLSCFDALLQRLCIYHHHSLNNIIKKCKTGGH